MNPKRGCWSLVSAAQMRALDQYTIGTLGVPGEILMESAGRAALGPALEWRRRSSRRDAPVLVLCGVGNNGGDGFVLARHLLAEGIPAKTLRVGPSDRLSDDARANWQRLERIDAPRATHAVEDLPEELESASLIVDALFGTGLSRPLEGSWREWIRSIDRAREAGTPVLSIDLPSGLCADTGQILGAAVHADATITISAPKIGLALEPGRTLAGEIRVARVGISDDLSTACAGPGPAGEAGHSTAALGSPEVLDPQPSRRVELWGPEAAVAHWPRRPREGHKGTFGRVLIVGGSPGLLGAVALSARGALRAGAGLVTAAYPLSTSGDTPDLPVEAMSRAIASTAEGGISRSAAKTLLELAAARDAVAVGPGLGRSPELREWLPELLSDWTNPVVIDADGLFAFTGQLDRLRERKAATVLTPHPGEAAALLETDADVLNRDRVSAARRLAERSGAVVVLKGAASVIAAPDGRALIVPTGGPILASGGTGDTLTGIVVSLLARGIEAFEAAGLAAWWHGASGDRLVRLGGHRAGFGLLASELADGLPAVVSEAFANPEMAVRGGGEERHDPLLLRFP